MPSAAPRRARSDARPKADPVLWHIEHSFAPHRSRACSVPWRRRLVDRRNGRPNGSRSLEQGVSPSIYRAGRRQRWGEHHPGRPVLFRRSSRVLPPSRRTSTCLGVPSERFTQGRWGAAVENRVRPLIAPRRPCASIPLSTPTCPRRPSDMDRPVPRRELEWRRPLMLHGCRTNKVRASSLDRHTSCILRPALTEDTANAFPGGLR